VTNMLNGGGGMSFQSFSSGGAGMGNNMMSMNMNSSSTQTQSVFDPNTGGTKQITTTTQTVNGQQTKRIETTLIYPDGTRETTTEQVDGGNSASMKALTSSDHQHRQNHQQQQSLPYQQGKNHNGAHQNQQQQNQQHQNQQHQNQQQLQRHQQQQQQQEGGGWQQGNIKKGSANNLATNQSLPSSSGTISVGGSSRHHLSDDSAPHEVQSRRGGNKRVSHSCLFSCCFPCFPGRKQAQEQEAQVDLAKSAEDKIK
jgi:hypothetical protein